MDEQRKKVLYIITKDDVGGAQKYVADLASHLDRASFDIRVIRGGSDIPSLSNKIAWYTLCANDWRALFSIISVYLKERPDIIHLNSSKAGVVGSFAAGIYKLFVRLYSTSNTPNPRVIFTAHGWVFNPSNALSPFVKISYRLIHTIAALFQDTIICVSEYDRTLAVKLHIAPAHKLITIHNGIDYKNLNFLDKVSARREIIEKLDPIPHTLNPNFPWIGSIGRLTKEKDYGTLIETASKISNAFFFIIGEGPEKVNVQRTVNDLQLETRFFLIPPTSKDSTFLKAFDMFTLTSIKEGLPYALLEAGAAGLPAVVTDAGGMSEVVLNGKTGIVTPQKNPGRLSEAYATLIEYPHRTREFGNKARRRIQREFSLTLMLQKTEDAYRSFR